MNAQDVIKRPLQTEKGAALNEAQNIYLFEVDKRANKVEIKLAVEKLFGVKVTIVRTVTTHGKVVRRGLNATRRANIKKAYVTLKQGEKISLFEGV